MANLRSQQGLNKNTPGFSLVETLVAISILLTITSSIMLLVNQSIDSSERLSNRLAASYLASDAIEYLRYRRDTYWLADSSNSFSAFLSNNIPNCSSACVVDTRVDEGPFLNPHNNIKNCSGSCETLRYNSNTKRYGYDSGGNWGDSKFTRILEINTNDFDSDGNDEEAVVTVTIEWTNRAGNISDLVLTDTLTAWGD